MHGTEVSEGKIELIADIDGVLKIRRDALLAVNEPGGNDGRIEDMEIFL